MGKKTLEKSPNSRCSLCSLVWDIICTGSRQRAAWTLSSWFSYRHDWNMPVNVWISTHRATSTWFSRSRTGSTVLLFLGQFTLSLPVNPDSLPVLAALKSFHVCVEFTCSWFEIWQTIMHPAASVTSRRLFEKKVKKFFFYTKIKYYDLLYVTMKTVSLTAVSIVTYTVIEHNNKLLKRRKMATIFPDIHNMR